jgi:hypothetical protein
MPASAPTGRRPKPNLSSCAPKDAAGFTESRQRARGPTGASFSDCSRASLAPGDVATVTRIDRLARSTFALFAIVKQIVDAKAQFRSLAEPWVRYRHQHRAADDCRPRRPRRRGARPHPHPHRRRPHRGAEARAAHGPSAEIDRRAEGRGSPARAERATLAELARSYHVGKTHDFQADMKPSKYFLGQSREWS